MPPQTIEKRVKALESRMTTLDEEGGRIARVESQIVQLRSEMHDGFSTTRAEFAELRAEMASGFAAVAAEFVAVRTEIRAGDEETRRFMRVLHEDLISRIATIQRG